VRSLVASVASGAVKEDAVVMAVNWSDQFMCGSPHCTPGLPLTSAT